MLNKLHTHTTTYHQETTLINHNVTTHTHIHTSTCPTQRFGSHARQPGREGGLACRSTRTHPPQASNQPFSSNHGWKPSGWQPASNNFHVTSFFLQQSPKHLHGHPCTHQQPQTITMPPCTHTHTRTHNHVSIHAHTQRN